MINLQKKTKKYPQFILMSGLLVNLLVGCDKCLFKKTNTGLAYRIIKKGEGTKPKNGQLLFIDMRCETKEKKTVFNSADSNSPIILSYNDSTYYPDGGIYEAISMLEKGDSIIFQLPAKTILGNSFAELANVHKLEESTLLYTHLYMNDIKDEAEFIEQQLEKHTAMLAKKKEQDLEQLPKDIEIIDSYLKKNHIKAFHTSSGLRYVIDKPGIGNNPQPGDTVKVNYVGKNLAGKIFDTNISEIAKKNDTYNSARTYEPMEFKIGEGGMIEGFEEGVKLLKKQAKARLFIPSVLAYGDRDLGADIKPYENLIFEIELVDVLVS